MNVDAYIESLSPVRRERLEAVRVLVRDAFPDVVEAIEWKMPVFRRGDKWIAAASQKSYLSIYLGCAPIAAQVAAVDPRLGHGKSCVNIRDTVPLPVAALAEAVREVLG